ncbi:MAG TPA: ankyrin repeat domain-containing protein, partial [Planctomycetota bacterium]|nr:ankyrin repeat domain-containing protein [Planctomycetota bacterium]
MPNTVTSLLLALPLAAQDPAEVDRVLRAGDPDALEALVAAPATASRALVRAVEIASPEVVEHLLELGAPLDAAGDDFGTTPLMAAVGAGRRDLGLLLLGRGADPDVRDVLGDPAVNWAAYMGDAPFVALLLEAGADATLTSPHGDALGIALRRGNATVVDALLASRGVERDPELATVVAGLYAGSTEALAAWLAAGGDARVRDSAGTPLVAHAAGAGSLPALEALLAAGAEVDARDAIGFTPLFAAVRRGSREAVEALLAAGARAEVVALPLGMSMTALFLAGEAGRLDLITLLVEAGAPLDARNTLGQSALGWSLAFGRTAAVERLLELGATADQVDAMGRTPAALARELGME